LTLTSADGQVTLHWSESAGETWALESTNALGSGAWENVNLNAAIREGTQVRFTQPRGVGARFFRLRKQ